MLMVTTVLEMTVAEWHVRCVSAVHAEDAMALLIHAAELLRAALTCKLVTIVVCHLHANVSAAMRAVGLGQSQCIP